MPSMKLLFTVLSLAILNISFNSLPTYALAVERDHIARSFNHAHAGITKKKRSGSSKRCKPRASNSSDVSPAGSSSSSYTPSSTPVASSSNPRPDTATATSSPVPATTTVPSSSGNRKVGLAWSNHEDNKLSQFTSAHTHYIYNWQLNVYSDVKPTDYGLVFLPMIHSAADAPNAGQVVASHPPYIFGFNEPDIPSQANLSPQAAFQLWNQYIEPLYNQGIQLISPACTNSDQGFQWMQQFMKLCSSCHIAAIATHFYGTDSQDLEDHAKQLHDTFGLDIWVTEYACQDYSPANKQCDAAQVSSFLSQTQAFLESTSWTGPYFYFGAMTPQELEANDVNPLNALIDDNGDPSALGQQYLSG